jgi:hypothetical protein
LALLKQTVQMDRYNFEAHEALVDSYLGLRKIDEATAACFMASLIFDHNERALTLEARVIRAISTLSDSDGSASGSVVTHDGQPGAVGPLAASTPPPPASPSSSTTTLLPAHALARARACLERALAKNSCYTPAVYALVDIYRLVICLGPITLCNTPDIQPRRF